MVPKSPDPRHYLPQLDGVRAIAVILVVLTHAIVVPSSGLLAWAARHVLSNGWIGVDLFFALSGYLITSILLTAKTRAHYFRNFYARRFLRIFPLYYAVVAILAVTSRWMPFGSPRPLWPYLTYTSNVWTVLSGREWEPLGHAWSLAIEEQFYLVYPLVVMRLDTVRLRTLMLWIIGLSPLARLATNALMHPGVSYFLTITRLDVLAMGALIAITFEHTTPVSDRFVRRVRGALVGLTALSCVLWLTKQLDFKKLLFNAVGLTTIDATLACFLCLAALSGLGWFERFLRQPLLVSVGRVSYGIYLIHYPITRLVEFHARQRLPDDWWRTCVVAVTSVTLTTGLAALSWIVLERPILQLKRFFYEPGEGLPAADGEPAVATESVH